MWLDEWVSCVSLLTLSCLNITLSVCLDVSLHMFWALTTPSLVWLSLQTAAHKMTTPLE